MRIQVKRTIAAVTFVIICATALIIVRSSVLNRLKDELQDQIRSLNKTGLNVKYDSIYIDWRRNFMVIDALVIEKDAYDTTCIYPEFITAKQVRVEGFRFFTFLINQKLKFETVKIEAPHIVIRKHSRLLQNTASQKENEFSLSFGEILITDAHLEYTDSASCNLLADLNTSIRTVGLTLAFNKDKPFGVTMNTLKLDNTVLQLPPYFYTLSLWQMQMDLPRKFIDVDTLRITPHHTKLDFGRKTGHETDRFEGVIPFLSLSGIKLQYPDTFALHAASVNIQMFLKIFRDKRLPDKDKFTLLPIAQLRKLPFGLSIDTLEITKSFVSYEEFVDGAEASGMVYFDDLSALIYPLNTDPALVDGHTTVKARASFMGDGDLEMTTLWPWKTQRNYTLEGSLKNFQLTKINPIMEPVANMKVESGILESLTFSYDYNMTRSDGKIELRYHDLKLISYKDEEKLKKEEKKGKRRKNKDPEDSRKDNLKSFIINAFVIRKNMNENTPEEKRTGTVLFYRNTSRSVFNYWWKSLFSGIKSAYHLDKIKGKVKTSDKKNDKKKQD